MTQSSLLLLLSATIMASCASESTVALFEAVERGDVTAADQALLNQADINFSRFSRQPLPFPCRAGQSPLNWAAFLGNEAMVTLLIERGADLDTPSDCTPLAMAVIANKRDVARKLISHGASPIMKVNVGNHRLPTTVVMLAAELDRSDMIEVLLSENKPWSDYVDPQGRTALFYAAELDYSDSISALVKHGASINYQVPDSGQTALAMAVVNRKLEAVRSLLALNADPNIPYKVYGLTGTRTVTPLAVARQGSPDIVNLLEQAGARE
jgi:ankyrin repeat protein